MAYMEQLQSTLKWLVAAGEEGRVSLDGMLGPLTGAISDITGAAGELENIPIVGPAVGAKLGRVMRGISVAQSQVGQVASTYGRTVSAATQVQERLGTFKEQAAKVTSEVSRVAGNVSPSLANILPTGGSGSLATPLASAVKPYPHLLIIQPLRPNAQPYYFNLDTAAFDELTRKTSVKWAAQERLRRPTAQQAVGLGDEKMTLKGAIFPGFKGGIGQLDTLRGIARAMEPVNLTTGYGQVLGNWCLESVNEEQGALLAGGIPRKQAFTLEFVSYGDDMQNI